MPKVITLRPFGTDSLIARLAELQRKFDAGEWSGAEALAFVRETREIRERLEQEFKMTELQIEQALWNLAHN